MTIAAGTLSTGDSTRLIFVGGLHRSGTTPLARVLGDHPEISSFSGTAAKEDEGQHLQTVYPSARTYGGAGRFAFAPEAHLTEKSELATAQNAQRLLSEWTPHWDLSRPLLLEKSPPNLLMTRFLSALYPQAHILIVVRHPVTVMLSTRRWHGPTSSHARLLEHWVHAHEVFLSDAASVEHLHILKYEDLVNQPAQTLERVAYFLGLTEPVPSDALDNRRSVGYWEQWRSLRDQPRLWQRGLVDRLCAQFCERVHPFGYNLLDGDVLDAFPTALTPPGGETP